MLKQKDNLIDLEIIKMFVVYINNEFNVDVVNEEKMENEELNLKEVKVDDDLVDVVMACRIEICIEIQGVIEEVNEIIGEIGEIVEIDSVNKCV